MAKVNTKAKTKAEANTEANTEAKAKAEAKTKAEANTEAVPTDEPRQVTKLTPADKPKPADKPTPTGKPTPVDKSAPTGFITPAVKPKTAGKSSTSVKIHETDLYKPVHDYLEGLGYNVQGEVKGCDLAALMGDDLVIVELKTSFNLKLLAQAVKRQRAADSVYVAIPKPKGGAWTEGWRDMCMLLRRLELGLITVALDKEEGRVEVHFHPNTFDRLKSARSNKKVRHHIIKETISRSGQYNTGGSNRKKLITVYREQAIHIACCLMKYGQLSPAKLKKLGSCSKTPNILRDNHYGWFHKVSYGVYELNECAKEFMAGYPELVRHYSDIIMEHEKDVTDVVNVAGEKDVIDSSGGDI